MAGNVTGTVGGVVGNVVGNITGSVATVATPDNIIDGVWDEQRTGHTASGSFGEKLQTNALADEMLARDLGSGLNAGTAEERTEYYNWCYEQKNINKIKELGLDVMLNSPISVPSHIINMCDYYIQTKENPVLDLESKIVYSWAIYHGARNGHKDISVYHGTRDYGWANLYQIKKLSELALTYKYDRFYHIIYDLNIDDVVLRAFSSNDKVCNFYHFHEHWSSLHLMVFNRDNLLKFISYLTLEKYLEYHGIVEGWLENILKSNDIPYYMEDDYINDEIHFYEGINLYDCSRIKDLKYFLSQKEQYN